VLLIISGVLAVILVAKSRLHVYEPLQYVHASDPSIPYVEPLPNTYMWVLQLRLPAGWAQAGGGGGRRGGDEGGQGGGGGRGREVRAWRCSQ